MIVGQVRNRLSGFYIIISIIEVEPETCRVKWLDDGMISWFRKAELLDDEVLDNDPLITYS
jgi:hypothetical protein